jgi:hypothetical protein
LFDNRVFRENNYLRGRKQQEDEGNCVIDIRVIHHIGFGVRDRLARMSEKKFQEVDEKI